MDRSHLGQGAFAPTDKRSSARFRRLKKRYSTSRAMPATVASDSGAGLGLDPSTSELLYAAPFDRGEDSGSQFVREQLYGWNPFESDASNRSSSGTGFVFSAGLSGSTNSSNIGVGSIKGAAFDACDRGSGDIGKGFFAFGSGIEKVSNWNSSSSQSSTTQNLGNANSAKFKSVETGIRMGGSVFPVGEGNVFSEKGVFVFGSSGKNDGNLCRSSSLGSDNDSFYELNSRKNVDEKSGKLDSGFFVHRNGEKKSTHPSKNSSFVSGDGLFSEQPDRRGKKYQENYGNVDCQNADKDLYVFDLDQTSTMCSNGNSFFSVSKLPEDLTKLKINTSENGENGSKDQGIFVFGSGVHENMRSNGSSFFSVSKLPEDLTKLKINTSENGENGSKDQGVFVFGSGVHENMRSNGSSFFSVSKLPEDLMKLKINTSENGENGSKEQGVFVFGSGVHENNCASRSSSFESFDSSFSKLPQKLEKLNLVGQVHGNTESGFTASSLNKHSQFSQTSSGNVVRGFSMFPGEVNEQNLQSSGNEEHGNDNHGVFVFGNDARKNVNSGKSSSFNFDESSISKLPDEIKNLKLNSSGNEVDFQKSKPGNTWNQHDNNATSNFTSHSGKEDYGSRVAPLQAHNSCGLSAEPTSFPSAIPGFQTSMNHFYFTSMQTGSETPMEFRSQKQDTSLLTKENLFTKPHKNMTSGMKKEDSKGVRPKNKRDKSRKSTPMQAGMAKQFVSVDKCPEENHEQDSTGGDSPMDYSPYQETLVSNQCSREAPIASDESIHFDSRCASNGALKSGFVNRKEGELFSAVEYFDTNESLHENEEADCCFRVPSASHFTSVDEMTSGLPKGSFEAINENVESVIQAKSSSMESKSFGFDSSIKQPSYEGEFTFNSCSQDASQSNLFAATSATSSVRGPSPASKRIYRRKTNVKGGQESNLNFKLPLASPASNMFLFTNAHVPTDPKQEQKGSDDGVRAGEGNAAKPNQESAEEACEKWRLRGNQAYADGNLSKAEDYYNRGVNSLSFSKNSKSCCRALMLCYSNRAATRMSIGGLREALSDCKMAVEIDSRFLRARVRAGNIHLFLGETADALQHFEKVLQLGKEAKSDQKILLEAVDGLEKTQKLNDLIDQCSVFLTKRTPDDATKVLEIISEALSIAPYSEILLEMKAEALVKLRNFDEAIQICEQTLEFAEKNASVAETGCQSKDTDCSKSMERSHSKFWRWRIMSKSYFYLGKLEEANDLLQKHEKVKPVIDRFRNRYSESSTSFPATVCELLRLKTAGNEAFQAGRHLEAVELYTAALALNSESRPFTAICFCNRAAAYQALGQITDAIADCSLAIALDSNYKRAISRRATLHEMIRDYGQAAIDLQKLTYLLEMRSEDKNSTSGALGRSSSNLTDLNQARMRLSTVEEEAQKGGTLDMYMILGIERSCSATDVRKAYRKAALRHHPDKAGQFLARSENGDDGVWREIAEEVHSDADRLFKIIGEAYAILVDASKRLQYDTEEDLRSMKKGYGPYRTPASSYSSQHERRSSFRRGSER